MAQLGILEGRIPPGARNRGLFGGTLASSRSRQGIGPMFFGDDGLSNWIYNAKALVNAKWSRVELDQIQRTGSGLTAAQKSAMDAELAQAAAEARAAYAVQAGSAAPAPARLNPSDVLSTSASAAAGRGRAAEAIYNQVKADALRVGVAADVATAIAKSAAQAVAAGLSYDYATAIEHARPGAANAPDVTLSTPTSSLMTQEQLRQYYEVAPASIPASSAVVPAASSASESPEDVLRHTFPGSAPAANAPASGKSLLVPVVALAAAYFFLKG